MLDVDLGFNPSRAAVIKVDYDGGGNAERRGAVLKEMMRNIEAIPGIEAAGCSGHAAAGPQSKLGTQSVRERLSERSKTSALSCGS